MRRNEVGSRASAAADEGSGARVAPRDERRPTRYVAVIADPPWRFENRGSRASPDYNARADGARRRSASYSTMTLDDVAGLPVESVAAEDCLLGLWAPAAMLLGTSGEPSSVSRVLAAWGGFRGVDVVPWVKGRWDGDDLVRPVGLGNYVRHAAEYLVIAVRGSVRVPTSLRRAGVLLPTAGAKGEAGRDLVGSLVPDGPRAELFARGSVEGWDVWGDEAVGVPRWLRATLG